MPCTVCDKVYPQEHNIEMHKTDREEKVSAMLKYKAYLVYREELGKTLELKFASLHFSDKAFLDFYNNDNLLCAGDSVHTLRGSEAGVDYETLRTLEPEPNRVQFKTRD